MKAFLSIEGWKPEKLKSGDLVIFIADYRSGKSRIHIGEVVKGYNLEETDDDNNIEGPWRVRSLTDGKEYEPYSSNVCLIEKGGNIINYLKSGIYEVDRFGDIIKNE